MARRVRPVWGSVGLGPKCLLVLPVVERKLGEGGLGAQAGCRSTTHLQGRDQSVCYVRIVVASFVTDIIVQDSYCRCNVVCFKYISA